VRRSRFWLAAPAVLAWVALSNALVVAQSGPAPLDNEEPSPEDLDRPVWAKTPDVPQTLTPAEAEVSLNAAMAFMVRTQNDNGSWASGTIEGVHDTGYSVASFYDWQVASCALACMALMEAEETPERLEAMRRSLRWICTSRLPKRGSDWDNDTMWAALYGTVLCVRATSDPRIAGTELGDLVEERGRAFVDLLVRNQVPTGGWGYYDDPPYSQRPKWATSFSTALVLPALEQAEALGWLEDREVLQRAIRYVRRCKLPNGAYEYDLRPIPRAPMGESINDVKGSLGRIQVCNWALFSCKDDSVSVQDLRTGLEPFLTQHKFLDVARMRPIPHEAFYANAGYFYFFGHYYAALAINELPEPEREAWHARLRPHLVKTQRSDGSSCDFLGQRYLVVSGTAFLALALQAGL